jgi:signal transduction histidine kinase
MAAMGIGTRLPESPLGDPSAIAADGGSCPTDEDATARRRVEAGLRDEIAALRRQIAERTLDLEVSRERLQAADRLASIGSLTAGLGHDLANVLFPIRCRLGALDWARVPAEVADTLQAVVHAAEYLQQLSDGLRLFSKDPSDAMAGLTTDLERWWLQIEPLLRKTMPARVALEADVPPGLPRPAVAPHQLTQALLNLVVNGAEAIEERGTVRLQIRSVASGRVVEVAVSDDGHGMSPEIRAHIFDPFFTTKRRGMSTGLGLSLVLGVIKSARGAIDVESEPGVGTRFVMRFPAAGAGQGAPGARPRGRAAILLADARQAGWAALHLENEGYEIDRTPAALDAADVLLIDADRDADTIATRFLEQSAARWVIACGIAPTFAHPRLVHVEGEGAMRGLQSAVRHVAGALSGESR